ncbi:Tricorn protease C1 domain-containing protein [Algoriphagus alkaliphilus]|uniref:Tricorn protease C1 domain-containing protein n=1 Tax=Algoriphagus alkaliphilus TaxID=279824 RepID=A0A1G5ZBD8_9BACT|nr:S41 family peptidase [Algoriphagus alkaliphilus]SDA91922.1 Tricorn protease C1 domain-containing protein [Algoriphagus alkaliphilus]
MNRFIKTSFFTSLLVYGLGLVSCNELMLGKEPSRIPISTFEYLWSTFNDHYGLFEVKQLDWEEIHAEFSGQVSNQMSDDELFDVCSEMLSRLNDGHVWLVKPNPGFRRFDSGPSYPEGTFDLDLIREHLSEETFFGPTENPLVLFGRFKNTNIGYLYLDHLGEAPGFYEKHVKTALAELANTDELILDARGIEGGDDRSAQVVASFFAKETKLYMKTRFKQSAKPADFSNWILWEVNPKSGAYTKPVVLLTDRGTGSAGETFTLAMRQNETVEIIGNFTYGAFSDNPKWELPNGWIVAMSTGDFRDQNGNSYEGIGLEPDELIANTPGEVSEGTDRALTRALSILLGN